MNGRIDRHARERLVAGSTRKRTETDMIYKQKFYFLCKTPLSAQGPEDVEVVDRTARNEEFPELFSRYEELRSHAFNEDKLYSIVRADDIYDLIRTTNEGEAKEEAFEKAAPEIVTNLQHRVMQKGDRDAEAILREVHGVEE
ncbi:MAG: hypothetical protein ACQER4_07235 [Bacteroidota bacterium]